MKDLVILTADKNAEYLLRGLIPRLQYSHNIEPLEYDIFSHPRRDPGCYNDGVEFLRAFKGRYKRCLLIFDYEGSGIKSGHHDAEQELESALTGSGWNQAQCIIISPELDKWIFANSNHLPGILGMDGKTYSELITFLVANSFTFQNGKPTRPKEALELILKEQRIPRSSSLYKEVASKVTYSNCIDTQFQNLLLILTNNYSPSLFE